MSMFDALINRHVKECLSDQRKVIKAKLTEDASLHGRVGECIKDEDEQLSQDDLNMIYDMMTRIKHL